MQLEEKNIKSFSDFNLAGPIGRGIVSAGFEEPRPIQRAAIPAILQGRDVLGLAQTGTGKTAAFALPILDGLTRRASRGPRALIVAPTRELAQQIDAEIRQLGRHIRLRTVTIYGGVSARSQVSALRAHPDIIVACPGRLLDLYGQRFVNFDHIETVVLDEADHMFDMGFLPDIRRILAALPPKRQNLLFSATMPKEIRLLADRLLKDPHVVELASEAPVETVEHALYPVEEKQKLELLAAALDSKDFASAIVFSRTKHRAKRLAIQLEKRGHRAVALQGNMSQNARDRAMSGFRNRSFDVLVATDIAARGIDVEKVSHVINYDVPTTPEAYTHRIGRTGRSEHRGKAMTFITHEDQQMVRAIERTIGSAIERRAITDGVEHVLEMPTIQAPRPSRTGQGRSAQGRNNGSGRSDRPARQRGRRSGNSSSGQRGSGRPRSEQSASTAGDEAAPRHNGGAASREGGGDGAKRRRRRRRRPAGAAGASSATARS